MLVIDVPGGSPGAGAGSSGVKGGGLGFLTATLDLEGEGKVYCVCLLTKISKHLPESASSFQIHPRGSSAAALIPQTMIPEHEYLKLTKFGWGGRHLPIKPGGAIVSFIQVEFSWIHHRLI